MDLIISPTLVALNPQLGAAVPALKPGDIIEAQVLALLGDGRAKLAVANTILEVQTQVPLTPGTTVRLAVKNTPDGIRLAIVGNPINSAARTPVPTSAAASAPAGVVPPAGAAEANQSAATPQAIAQTVTGVASGSASAPNTASTPPPAVTNVAAPLPPPDPATAAAVALTAAVQTSAARQNGLGPLFADAEVAVAIAALPEPVRQAAERILALRPALTETLSAAQVKQAVGRSGLFLEAHLAAASTGAPEAAPPPPDDLKAALVVLRNVIRTWLAAPDPDPAPVRLPGAPALVPNLAPISSDDVPIAPAIATGNAEQGTQAPLPASSAPPPPPYRGAPPAAQPMLAPSIAPDMAPRAIGKILLTEADAAVARQTLLQAASLPEHVEPGVRVDPSGPRWHFEVPFATPQGTAVAQFEIARDGHRAAADASKPVWRARFSLDVEPIGPVHAQIALIGTRTAVTLWAERPDTSARLREHARELTDALRGAELEPGDVLVRYGAPPRARETAASGRFLDRAS